MESYTRWIVARDELVCARAAVAAKHPLAVEVGLDVLRRGGNAVDAAVAAAFAVTVVEPYMSGVGGGGFLTFAPAEGDPVVVDYFMRAPRAATPTMYELAGPVRADRLGFRGVKDDANLIGHRAVAVPGLVPGLALALERFGTRRLADLLEPAIALAEDGFPVSWHFTLMTTQALDALARFSASRALFLPDGFPLRTLDPAAPARLRQPDLARTLRRLAERGPGEFRDGETARAIAAEVGAHGGALSADDLAEYQPRLLDPLRFTYRGDELYALPPGAGGSFIAQSLKLLEGFPLGAHGHNSPDALHLIAEASRLALADRSAFLGDETQLPVPLAGLLAERYLAERRALIRPDRALERPEPGDPWRHQGGRPAAGSGESAGRDEGCTTALVVVDERRNVVAITQTLVALYGSGVTVPGTGVLLNNALNLFDPQPGRPNSIAPGKRPLSNMAHTVVRRGGRNYLAVGAPGGRRIIGTVQQVLLNVLDFGLGIQAACSGPFIDCAGPEMLVSAQIAPEIRAELERRGHRFVVVEPSFAPAPFASPTGLLLDPASGLVHGGADPWALGVAAGY